MDSRFRGNDTIKFIMNTITKKQLITYFAEQKNFVTSNDVVTTGLKLASVLVPIIDNVNLEVLFTERTLHLKNHAGQISFPGGTMEAADKNLEETVLRETQEEIGLPPEKIQLIGTLQPLISSSNFLVTPFFGLITPPIKYQLDATEVAQVFTVPLNFLLDPNNHQREIYQYADQSREVYVIQYNEHRIWGLTAAILIALAKNLSLSK